MILCRRLVVILGKQEGWMERGIHRIKLWAFLLVPSFRKMFVVF